MFKVFFLFYRCLIRDLHKIIQGMIFKIRDLIIFEGFSHF